MMFLNEADAIGEAVKVFMEIISSLFLAQLHY